MKAKTKEAVKITIQNLSLYIEPNGDVMMGDGEDSYNIMSGKQCLQIDDNLEKLAPLAKLKIEMPRIPYTDAVAEVTDEDGNEFGTEGSGELRITIGCRSFTHDEVHKVASIVRKQLGRK